MFNEERKVRFLEEYTASQSVRKKAKNFFENVSSIERKFNKDLSALSIEELSVLLGDGTYKTSTLKAYTSLIKSYAIWSHNIYNDPTYRDIQNDTCGDGKNFLRLNYRNIKVNVQNTMVKDPEDLNEYLDELLDPIDYNTNQLIDRAAYWMVYSGIPQNKLLQITASNIDYENKTITIDGVSYPIYDQAVETYKTLEELTSFNVISQDRDIKYERLRDSESDQLLRGLTKIENILSIQSRSSRLLKKHSKELGRKISLSNAMTSGKFYRILTNKNNDMKTSTRGRFIVAEGLEADNTNSQININADFNDWLSTFYPDLYNEFLPYLSKSFY